MRTPEIELLWWEGCPSTERARRDLEAALAELGILQPEIRMREIATGADALEAGFRGSPTIRIDGADLVAADSAEPIGLSCRIYRRRDGRISPTPDPADLRAALATAAARPRPEATRR